MIPPYVRVLIRALLAGIGAFGAAYQAGSPMANSIVAGLIVAAGLASVELGTPVNATVGVGKG